MRRSSPSRDTQFTAVKAPGTLRVFLLGSSAAAGWPHHEQSNGYTIAADLARKLRMLYPEKLVEVLNVAGPTYGSHRVKFVFDEIITEWKDVEAARPAVFFAELHKRWIEAGR